MKWVVLHWEKNWGCGKREMGESLEGNIVRVMSVEREERKSETSMMRILVWEKTLWKEVCFMCFYKIQRRESEKKENKFIWWLFYVTILQFTVLSPMLGELCCLKDKNRRSAIKRTKTWDIGLCLIQESLYVSERENVFQLQYSIVYIWISYLQTH